MSLVKSFTHLKGRPKENQALPLLQRIASLVKPIMRKHNWSLPVLGEFFPENDSLVGLNINAGQKILLRLRPPTAPDTFYDEEQLVLVMLHELTHNVHGPHDSEFYALLSKLEQEHEDLKMSNYTGEGFHSVGARLGVGVSHDLPHHLAKVKALEAAEKRRKTSIMMSGGGRLGGRAGRRDKTARELAAEAAERRARDERSCGSGPGVNAEVEAQRAAQESEVDVDTLQALSRKSEAPPDVMVLDGPSNQARRKIAEPLQKASTNTAVPPTVLRHASAVSPLERFNKPPLPSTKEWSCHACTLLNAPLALQCAACFSSRPPDPNAGWTCLSCGEQGMSHDFWACQFCGQVKLTS